ncbi:Uncharacterised protein [Vibrio cholerae]|nr:Uncharacterised protein [Vibrio cholerae]
MLPHYLLENVRCKHVIAATNHFRYAEITHHQGKHNDQGADQPILGCR